MKAGWGMVKTRCEQPNPKQPTCIPPHIHHHRPNQPTSQPNALERVDGARRGGGEREAFLSQQQHLQSGHARLVDIARVCCRLSGLRHDDKGGGRYGAVVVEALCVCGVWGG